MVEWQKPRLIYKDLSRNIDACTPYCFHLVFRFSRFIPKRLVKYLFNAHTHINYVSVCGALKVFYCSGWMRWWDDKNKNSSLFGFNSIFSLLFYSNEAYFTMNCCLKREINFSIENCHFSSFGFRKLQLILFKLHFNRGSQRKRQSRRSHLFNLLEFAISWGD